MKTPRQGLDLPNVERALAAKNFSHYALASDLGQIALRQVVLFHQKSQQFLRPDVGNRIVLLIVRLYQQTQGVDKADQQG